MPIYIKQLSTLTLQQGHIQPTAHWTAFVSAGKGWGMLTHLAWMLIMALHSAVAHSLKKGCGTLDWCVGSFGMSTYMCLLQYARRHGELWKDLN